MRYITELKTLSRHNLEIEEFSIEPGCIDSGPWFVESMGKFSNDNYGTKIQQE
jgi:hypothetical protein